MKINEFTKADIVAGLQKDGKQGTDEEVINTLLILLNGLNRTYIEFVYKALNMPPPDSDS